MRSEVEVAGNAGFCFGVRRAVEQVEALARSPREGRLLTLGPLIHNQAEVQRLQDLGVLPVGEAEIQADDDVVVRAHGAGPDELRELRRRARDVHDATCPYVRSLQTLARRLVRRGYKVILVGDREHPEVRAVLGWAREGSDAPERVAAVASSDELATSWLPGNTKVALLAQTTQSPERLREVASACLDRLGPVVPGAVGPGRRLVELRCFDTICACTRQRQAEARALAARADLVLVVGDRHSANTRRLVEVCRAVQPRTMLVEELGEIDPSQLLGVRRIAVASGASTPVSTIHRIVAWLRDLEHE